jgi:hypothetical protein
VQLGLYCKPVSPTKPNPMPKTLLLLIFSKKNFFAAVIILFAVGIWRKRLQIRVGRAFGFSR